MPDFVVWKDTYSVGVQELDGQHKNIWTLLNRLYEGLQDGVSRQEINDLLTQLQRHGQLHLSEEEALMEAHNYPDLEAHRHLHSIYKEQMQDLARDAALNEEVSHELFRFLKQWWINHVTNVDQKYAPFLRNSS